MEQFKVDTQSLTETKFQKDDNAIIIVYNSDSCETFIVIKGNSLSLGVSIAYCAKENDNFYNLLKSVVWFLEKENGKKEAEGSGTD